MLNCIIAEAAAVSTDLIPLFLCLAHLFHTCEFIDSLAFFEIPGKHLFSIASSHTAGQIVGPENPNRQDQDGVACRRKEY